MQVSVVIPTYNRAHTLGTALDSVFRQTLVPAQVIVVDDGSTDATATLVRNQYPGVLYLRQENQGVSNARNHGIKTSSSDWIAFLDSDDSWDRKKLERQSAALAEQPEHLVCHTDEIWIRHGKRVNQMKKHHKKTGWIFQDCLPLCAMSPSSCVIHRSVLEKTGLFDESLPACEDYDLWLRICSQYPVLLVNDPLVIKTGGHADQLSRKYWGMDRFRIKSLQKLLESNVLQEQDRIAATRTLTEKTTIVLQGARKRANHSLVDQCKRILEQYSNKPHPAIQGVSA